MFLSHAMRTQTGGDLAPNAERSDGKNSYQNSGGNETSSSTILHRKVVDDSLPNGGVNYGLQAHKSSTVVCDVEEHLPGARGSGEHSIFYA